MVAEFVKEVRVPPFMVQAEQVRLCSLATIVSVIVSPTPRESALPVADVVAAGNIGCMEQIGGGVAIPVVHTVELLDWATGGPCPEALTQ